MVKKRYLYCCCVILFLSACKEREQNSLSFKPPVFSETIQVTVTPLPNNFLLDRTSQMEDVGGFLVIISFQENNYLHVFEKETGTYIKSFGSYGRGPGELLTTPQIRVNEDKSKLYAFQRSSALNEYWSYNVEDILHYNQVLPVQKDQITLHFDEEARSAGGVLDFLAWRDKRLFIRNRLHRFEIQDTLGHILCLYDKYPAVSLKQASDSVAFHDSYLYSTLALKPDMSRFVIASGIGCIMEIFTIDSSGIIEKESEKRFHPPVFTVNKNLIPNYYVSGQTILGINSLFVTDELIYAMYHGKLYNPDKPEGYLINTIAIFDWTGNPIRRYILNWEIETFVVDTQRNRCYLVGIDADEEILLGYFDL